MTRNITIGDKNRKKFTITQNDTTWSFTCVSCYTSMLFQVESVAKVVEGDGQMIRATQGSEFTIGWRVGD